MANDRDIVVETCPYVAEALRFLAQHGAFGADPEEVAELLLREKIRELERQGWLNPKVNRRLPGCIASGAAEPLKRPPRLSAQFARLSPALSFFEQTRQVPVAAELEGVAPSRFPAPFALASFHVHLDQGGRPVSGPPPDKALGVK